MEIGLLVLFVVVAIVVLIALSSSTGDDKHATQYCETTASELPKVRVRYIIDGDTVIVSKSRREMRIRLYAIDCPEDGQHWGNIAKAGLIKLIGGRDVLIEKHGVDKHGRTLATIYVQGEHRSDWVNVNERMVMLGHAWVMRKCYGHLPTVRQNQLNRLERWARSKRVGLWNTNNPIPPWRWRNQG